MTTSIDDDAVASIAYAYFVACAIDAVAPAAGVAMQPSVAGGDRR